MTAVSTAGKNDDERLVGLLHDLVEDKDWTFDDLLQDGFPRHIVDTLRLLTHDKETPYRISAIPQSWRTIKDCCGDLQIDINEWS